MGLRGPSEGVSYKCRACKLPKNKCKCSKVAKSSQLNQATISFSTISSRPPNNTLSTAPSTNTLYFAPPTSTSTAPSTAPPTNNPSTTHPTNASSTASLSPSTNNNIRDIKLNQIAALRKLPKEWMRLYSLKPGMVDGDNETPISDINEVTVSDKINN